jgi:hypothetical protein
MQALVRRGRPPGSITVSPKDIIRRRVHFTVHRTRQPLLAAWLAQHDERGLAADLVDLIERALAGRDVAVAGSGGDRQTEVFEIDMSGLMDWD